MKIEIDLNDVFRDEEGNPNESLEEAVRRQVIDRLTEDYRKKLFAKLDGQIAQIMESQVSAVVAMKMPSLIDDILNAEYTPVDRYGSRSEKTTFRAEIIKSIAANMVYKPTQYQSEANAFTQAVQSVVEHKTNEIQKVLREEIDTKFKADAIGFAVKELSKRLGLEK